MASTLRPFGLKATPTGPISGLRKASHLKGTEWLPPKNPGAEDGPPT